jgi:hypothetical protein
MGKAIFFDFWGTLWIPNIEDPSLEKVAEEAVRLGIVKNTAEAKIKARRWGGFPALGACSVLVQTAKICPQFIVSHSQHKVLSDILKDWDMWKLFTGVESTHNRDVSKVVLINKICLENKVEPLFYVGDSFGDAQLAKEMDISYIHLGKRADFIDIFGYETKKAKMFPAFFPALRFMLEIIAKEFDLPFNI